MLRTRPSTSRPHASSAEQFARVESVLAALRQGQLVVVTDDAEREGEGDLVVPAHAVSPEQVAFMVRHTSGIVCAALSPETAESLELPQMVAHNTDGHGTAFTVTVDAAEGTTTGISAHDRSLTLRALADPASTPVTFRRPGHIFPLRAQSGGVLQRRGHTEGAVDLMTLAGQAPVAAISELCFDDGTVMTIADAIDFAAQHGLPSCSIDDIVAYRSQHEAHPEGASRLRALAPVRSEVELVSGARLPTAAGLMHTSVYLDQGTGLEHVVCIVGDPAEDDVLVRIHSECFTGDVLRSHRCDCGNQLDIALQQIVDSARGVLIYLRGHEGRGIGIGAKLAAYQLQDDGYDTVDANIALGYPVDAREYSAATAILEELGVRSVHLLTNNLDKVRAVEASGIPVHRRIPLVVEAGAEARQYLETKRARMGHLLPAAPYVPSERALA